MLRAPLSAARGRVQAPIFRLPVRRQSSFRPMSSYVAEFSASIRAIPTPVKALIGANVLVFVAYAAYADSNPALRRFFKQHMTLSRPNMHRGRYDSIFGSMFMHTGIVHMGFNLFTLHSFGPIAVAYLGAAPFLGLYAGAGAVGAIAQLAYAGWAPSAGLPASPWVRRDAEYVGASGAICGVLGYVFTRVPQLPVNVRRSGERGLEEDADAAVMGRGTSRPLPLLLLLLLLLQVFFIPATAAVLGPVGMAISLYCLWAPGPQGVGHADHLGGFLTGVAVALVHARARR